MDTLLLLWCKYDAVVDPRRRRIGWMRRSKKLQSAAISVIL